MQSLREAVSTKIASAGATIHEKVAEIMAQEIIDKRIKQVHAAMTELDNSNRELRKWKPDQVSYDEKGVVQSSSFSKKAVEERKKITDRIDKINRAVARALDQNDFGELIKLQGNKGGGDKSDDDGDEPA